MGPPHSSGFNLVSAVRMGFECRLFNVGYMRYVGDNEQTKESSDVYINPDKIVCTWCKWKGGVVILFDVGVAHPLRGVKNGFVRSVVEIGGGVVRGGYARSPH
jgi:hypothetical protein